MTSMEAPACMECRHYERGTDDPVPRCAAYPDGIPDAIFFDGNPHTAARNGDHGIRFEPLAAIAEAEAYPGTEWRTINGRRVCISGDCPKGTRIEDLGERGVENGKPGAYVTRKDGSRDFLPDPAPADLKALRERVEYEERLIKDKPVEYAVCMSDAKDFVRFRKEGTKYEVKFTRDEAERMEHSIMLHNHPVDYSFSNADLVTAITVNASEFRVVSSAHRYILSPGADGWPDLSKVKACYEEERAAVRSDLVLDVNQGKTTAEEADRVGSHLIMERVAKRSKGRLVYRREKL